jgi:hypothetical protein
MLNDTSVWGIPNTIVNGSSRRQHCRYRSPRRHFRQRERAAVRRALTGASLYLDRKVPTLTAAAMACGSNAPYIRSAIVLLKTENFTLVDRVLAGHVPLMAAAREARPLAELVGAYRSAAAEDHVAFARVIGPTALFDTAVAPAM